MAKREKKTARDRNKKGEIGVVNVLELGLYAGWNNNLPIVVYALLFSCFIILAITAGDLTIINIELTDKIVCEESYSIISYNSDLQFEVESRIDRNEQYGGFYH